jgi:hypothetical protein
MTRLIVDSTTGARLSQVKHPLELCDDSGRVLGHFVPAVDPALYPKLEPQISEDEMRRREQKGGGRPLSAILADLEKRA